MIKEFLYVGHYFDTEGNYILKIGTTNDLDRRRKEHTRNYRKAPHNSLPQDKEFVYDWHLPLSKYNTRRYEDKNRELWQEAGIGEYIRNDRFNCGNNKPNCVTVTIKKTYEIALIQSDFFV